MTKNISLIVLSITLLGLWSCNKSQSIDNAAKESLSEIIMPEIDVFDAEDNGDPNEGVYNEFLAAFQPWTSRILAP